jgi:hypothetical protein
LFNTSDRNASHKADEFSEIDALADDLLMADFDISADNEDANEFADSANADPAESLIERPLRRLSLINNSHRKKQPLMKSMHKSISFGLSMKV